MVELPPLRALVDIVDGRTDGQSTLQRITVAEELTAELRLLGDRLIGYYVELARGEGYSWTDIGAHLGVSRQAAQQRYTPRWSSLTLADLRQAGAFTRLTARCKDALARAEEHARRLRHDSVGTEHLLLGMLEHPDTVAVRALRAQGAGEATLRAAVAERVHPGETPSPSALPVGPAARRALETALREALDMGHNYIGTEHILLALLHDTQGGAGAVLAGSGVALGATRSSIQDILSGYLRRQG